MISIAINGAAGRMGQRVLALALQDSELSIAAALESPESSFLGEDIGRLLGLDNVNIEFTATTKHPIDIVIDFSNPRAADRILDFCLENKVGLVMATTGLEPTTVSKLETESHLIPIVWSPNMSLAVNLTMKLSQVAAKALKNHSSGVDVEILERHHRFKADAPSGTALKFGEVIAREMELTEHRHGRHGMLGQRPRKEIGYHAIRTGDDPGQHTILFGMMGETIELRVAASNRDCYAAGALEAAKFLVHKGPGLYSMYDVLGL